MISLSQHCCPPAPKAPNVHTVKEASFLRLLESSTWGVISKAGDTEMGVTKTDWWLLTNNHVWESWTSAFLT